MADRIIKEHEVERRNRASRRALARRRERQPRTAAQAMYLGFPTYAVVLSMQAVSRMGVVEFRDDVMHSAPRALTDLAENLPEAERDALADRCEVVMKRAHRGSSTPDPLTFLYGVVHAVVRAVDDGYFPPDAGIVAPALAIKMDMETNADFGVRASDAVTQGDRFFDFLMREVFARPPGGG